MKLTPLQRHWLSMAKKHRLAVDTPFILNFPDGGIIHAEVRLRDYGNTNGMLLVSDYSVIGNRSDEIVEMGFGFSCLPQPSEDEIDSDKGLADLLEDWGKNSQ
jgi:hypothetical protein